MGNHRLRKRTSPYILMLILGLGAVQTAYGADGATPSAGQATPPSIQFTENTHDFGEQPQNAAAQHTFTFKNTGGETLVIEKIKAG